MKSPVEKKAGKKNFKLNEACIDLQIFGTLIMLTVYVGSVKEKNIPKIMCLINKVFHFFEDRKVAELHIITIIIIIFQ